MKETSPAEFDEAIVSKIKLCVFSGSQPTSSEAALMYEKAYILWKEVWGHVINVEMGKSTRLFSDEISKQSKIVSLFFDNIAVGVAFYKIRDLDSIVSLDDSFFRFWPQDSINKLKALSSKRISLASNFTVHPDFRKSRMGICWKGLLLQSFVNEFAMEEEAEVMTTAARKIRSNEKLCFKHGATVLSHDIPYLTLDGLPIDGEIADLVVWDKRGDKILQSNNQLSLAVWNSRLNLNK